MLTRTRRLARLRFFLSWWAYSFPLAAITVATLAMHRITAQPVFPWLGLGLLVLFTMVVGCLS